MRVLLTNDDGIRAEGLRAMYRALREAGHTVHVVAPMHEQSGVGHSLTFFDPLRAHKIEEPDFEGLGLYGTPTDCVKLALGNLLKKRPDMVISGINAGSNVGPDILYSGTVGAATEAAHEDLPSMALSCDVGGGTPDMEAIARHAVELAARIDWKKVPHRRVINVNYPRGPLSEAKGRVEERLRRTQGPARRTLLVAGRRDPAAHHQCRFGQGPAQPRLHHRDAPAFRVHGPREPAQPGGHAAFLTIRPLRVPIL